MKRGLDSDRWVLVCLVFCRFWYLSQSILIPIPRRSCRFASTPAASTASGKGRTRTRSRSPPTPAALSSRPRGGVPPGGNGKGMEWVALDGWDGCASHETQETCQRKGIDPTPYFGYLSYILRVSFYPTYLGYLSILLQYACVVVNILQCRF